MTKTLHGRALDKSAGERTLLGAAKDKKIALHGAIGVDVNDEALVVGAGSVRRALSHLQQRVESSQVELVQATDALSAARDELTALARVCVNLVAERETLLAAVMDGDDTACLAHAHANRVAEAVCALRYQRDFAVRVGAARAAVIVVVRREHTTSAGRLKHPSETCQVCEALRALDAQQEG